MSSLGLIEKCNESINKCINANCAEKLEIAKENRKHIDLAVPQNIPLVSIVMLNRDGLNHLNIFFSSFRENTIYKNYEIIAVDNGSTDGSAEFLELQSRDLPLRIIKNSENRTYSEANNQAVKWANGEFILLLNNDVEPTFGWLNEMVRCALRYDRVGAVGARLVYPDCSGSILNKEKSFKIQHSGIAFKKEKDFVRPYNMGNGSSAFDSGCNIEKSRAAVTGAALLIRKSVYEEVGGLDESYNYGYEDVDLGLKLLKSGYQNIYCPTALLFHYEFGTQSKDDNEVIRERRTKNKEVFCKKWYKWLKQQMIIDKLNSSGLFTEEKLKVSFAVTEYGPNAAAGDYFTASELANAMKGLGWEVSYLPRKGPEDWYSVDIGTDVLVSMLESYDPRKITNADEGMIKIAWARNWFDRWANSEIINNYDIVCASSKTACDYMENIIKKECILLPIATNQNKFRSNLPVVEKFACDYCFTGSYWNDPREIIDFLDPEKLPYRFNLYGKNWDKIDKFKPYYKGFIQYDEMSSIYSSTKIVIDDANRVTWPYGAVNSRVYDAIASGVLVVTNGALGAEETFNGLLPSFRSQQELFDLITFYMENEDERMKKINQLREFVITNHTYFHRAAKIKHVLLEKLSAK